MIPIYIGQYNPEPDTKSYEQDKHILYLFSFNYVRLPIEYPLVGIDDLADRVRLYLLKAK